MLRTIRLILVALLLAASASVQAENWPRFRGPNGSGISSETGIPLEWSEKKNLAWKADLPGPGSSSPIAWGDRVFITCYSGYGENGSGGVGDMLSLNRHLLCLDASTGRTLWEKTIAAPLPEDPYQGFISEHGYASHTPTTDGERVFVFFGKGGVIAFDYDGKELWRHDLGSRMSTKGWGSATSPIIHGENVIVNAAEESNAIYAFDRETGEQSWKAEADSLVSIYGAPAISTVSADRDDLIISVPGEIWGMNPETGKLRWFAETDLTGNISPSPIVAGERIIQFGGYPRTMGVAIKAGGKGDVSETHRIWQNNDSRSYITAPILHDGLLYWVTDQGIACCADPDTGELVYEERLEGASGRGGRGKPIYASQVLIDGHLIAVTRTGGTFVIPATPDFEVAHHHVIAGDETRFQGTPAVSSGRLFLRSEQALYAIGAGGAE